MLVSDGWNDPRLSYGVPGHVGDSGSRGAPRSGHPASNLADDNSFLGHEVGAWKGSDPSWRADDQPRIITVTSQPVDGRPAPLLDTDEDSFIVVAGGRGRTAGDRNLRLPVHDESFHHSRDPQDHNSSRQQSFADMRPLDRPLDGRDQNQGAGRLPNGSGGRYPAMYDTGSGL